VFRGLRNHSGLALVLSLVAGCASLPERHATPPPTAATEVPATATIPPPVPVEVLPETPAEPPVAATEQLAEQAAAEGDASAQNAPAEEVAPAPMGPPPDLLDRVRSGLALGKQFNSRIDREADYFANHPDYVERTFDRAAPYLHYIVHRVQARGLPLELALLPVIESAFQPYAYSRASASGLWQFMAATGSRFSLKQDWWYDGRRDIVAATDAALDYLTYLHDMFNGDWLLAIAAYNCGEANVSKAIRRNKAAGKRTDFWNLRLPAETRGYVPRLLAITRIVANPEDFGLAIDGIPDTPYFEPVETGGQISIEVAAELAGITTEQMYELNPAYHRWATDPSGPYLLLVPVESVDAFRTNLLMLTPDQRLRVERYTVREGDTVTSIAARFGTNAQHLQELNGLGTATKLAIDSELRVPSAVTALPEQVRLAAARVDSRLPGGVRAVHVVRNGDTLSVIAQRHHMSVTTLARINGIKTTSTLRIGQKLRLNSVVASASASGGIVASEQSGDSNKVTYVVRSGDTLSGIAQALKVTVSALREWNNITGSVIRAGQRLVAYVDRKG
jgi:membrane-bound lytic murein transglycosylase D